MINNELFMFRHIIFVDAPILNFPINYSLTWPGSISDIHHLFYKLNLSFKSTWEVNLKASKVVILMNSPLGWQFFNDILIFFFNISLANRCGICTYTNKQSRNTRRTFLMRSLLSRFYTFQMNNYDFWGIPRVYHAEYPLLKKWTN